MGGGVKPEREYPNWICWPCGDKLGRRECGTATWHKGLCEVCNRVAMVTEPCDFGHLHWPENNLDESAILP